ncbi:DUF7467 domain-containing protein [Novipirellula maiorica]|nr:SdrD B-like domain-containing protein [Rhodopirellula maiorica]
MMALLGVSPSFPTLDANFNGSVQYNAATDTFVADATPLLFKTSFFSFGTQVQAPKSFQLEFKVDDSGNFAGGVAGDDFKITGSLSLDSDSIPDVTGDLLTGEVIAFGYADSGSSTTTDVFDLRLQVTGGALSVPGVLSASGNPRPAYYADRDIGMRITSENSTFDGNFDVDFGGDNKTLLGPIEREVVELAELGNFVWLDVNRNGIQDDGDTGVNGVSVHLYADVDGDGVAEPGGDDGPAIATQVTTTLGTTPGYYLFEDLDPGAYFVVFDSSTLPSGFEFTTEGAVGSTDANDSDADPVTGVAAVTTLGPGESDLTWDAGIVLASDVAIKKYTRVDKAPGPAIDIEKLVKPLVVHSGNICEATGKTTVLTLQYNPSTSVNTAQDPGKATANGSLDASPTDTYIVVGDGGSNVFFAGTVAAGDSFTASSSLAGTKSFMSNTIIEVFDNQSAFQAGAAALQTMQYHTSCSQPIRLGDVIGSVQVVEMAGKEGAVMAPAGFGEDADTTASGPEVMVGSEVMWTYVVTNPDPNDRPIANVVVVDDAGTPNDPADDFYPDYVKGDDGDGLLELGEQWIYTAKGTVELAGQYRNIGKVTGNFVDSGAMVMDDDPAHHFGVTGEVLMCSEVGKPVVLTFDYVGGSNVQTDQDPGKAGTSGVVDSTPHDSFFFVTNSTDLHKVFSGAAANYFSGTVSLQEPFTAKAANADSTKFSSNMMIYMFDNVGSFNAGDAPLQTMQYHTSCSQPINLGDVIGGVKIVGAVGETGSSTVLADQLPPLGPLELQGPTVVLEGDHPFDASNIGVPADLPTGPMAQLGDKVTFTYEITNPGGVPLSNVMVTDNTGVVVEPVLQTNGANVGDMNEDGLLDPSETWYYQAVEIADAVGQQMNIGKVTADPGMVMAENPSHHFVNPLSIEKFTRGKAESSGLVGADVCGDLGLDDFDTLTLRYEGNNVVSNPQEGKAVVVGNLSDPAPMDVYIIGSKDSDGERGQFFAGNVGLGDAFDLTQAYSDTSFGSSTYVLIYDTDPSAGGTLLQTIDFHTSCSKPLRLGDIFGGVTLVGVTDEDGDSARLAEPNPIEHHGEDADTAQEAVPITLGDKVIFTYEVTNHGSTPITLDNVIDDNGTPGDASDDLYWQPPSGVDQAIMAIVDEAGHNVGDINRDGLLDANETWLFEAMDIVRQEGVVGNKGVVTGSVQSDGVPVPLMDMDMSHHVGVLPAIDLCETGEQPTQLNMRYTASDEFNHAQGDKSEINVSHGSLVGVSSVFVRVTDDEDAFATGVEMYFGGTVNHGDVFGIDATLAGRSHLRSKIFVHFLDPTSGDLIRTVEVHASCSAPLVLGNQFAGAQLVGFIGDEGAILGLQPRAMMTGDGNVVAGDVLFTGRKMKFTLTNVGNDEALLESLVFNWAEQNKKLKKIKIDGVEIFRTATGWSSGGLSIGSNDWKTGTVDNRTIAAGQIVLVEFEFEKSVSSDSNDYRLDMYFDIDGDDDDDDDTQTVGVL